MPLEPADVERAASLLSTSTICRNADPGTLRRLARLMSVRTYVRNEDIIVQDEPSDCFHLVAEGQALRLRTDADGVEHQVDTRHCGTAVNSLHVVQGDPVYATARCASDTCKTFVMGRADLLTHLENDPILSRQMIASLSRKVRARTKSLRTPLMEQKTKEFNFAHVTIAAAIESYYRAALNSLLNHRLSGVKSALLPNMHIQVPCRVMYINGFKSLRSLIDKEVHPEEWKSPGLLYFATMVSPGVIMTPVSSILEACNAGHMNPEPIYKRSLRGTLPRGLREIIFGVGLNQMSDYFEERWMNLMPHSPFLANVAGSLTAGVVAGYFSHVPHNISTYKLLEPQRSYRDLFRMFVDQSVPDQLVPRALPPAISAPTRALLALLFPRGVVIRTAQIVGSFVILNGVIYLLGRNEQKRFENLFAPAAHDDQLDELDDLPALTDAAVMEAAAAKLRSATSPQ